MPVSSMSSFCRLVLVVAAIAPVLVASRVVAQPSGDPTVRARELYQEGRRLGELGRWEQARAAFEEALALREAPLLYFALGTAQAETGRLVAARASLRRFIATAADDAARSQLPAAHSAMAALEPRIAQLTIHVSGGTPHEVRLDGVAVEAEALGRPIDVDPGAHRVEVRASAGASPIVREAQLAQGARQEITIELTSLLPRADRSSIGARRTRADEDTTSRGGGVLTQWWFWTAVGVVVVGTTVGVVVATQSGARDPFAGDAPMGAIQTLRLP